MVGIRVTMVERKESHGTGANMIIPVSRGALVLLLVDG